MSDSYPESHLPWRKGFWSLMATQFQNAFSDNALKNLVVLLLLARFTEEAMRQQLAAAATFLFSAPFILFSMLGGWLADRFSKAAVMRGVKFAEMFIMLFAAGALALKSLPLELAAIFFMGCHSAIFGPSKYGILPELLPYEKLSWGNGLLELLTFLGIILGTVAGGFLAWGLKGSEYVCGLVLAVLAFAGWRMSQGITRVPPANPERPLRINPLADLIAQVKVMKIDRDLWRAVGGNTGFFFVAALIQVNLVLHANDVLRLLEWQNGLLNAALALGIGIGSATAGSLSRGRIEYGLVPIGAVGMALSSVPLGWPGMGVIGFSGWLAVLGFSGGLFIVPIAAVIQHRPPPDSKGAVQGAVNLLSFIGIALASGVQALLNLCHITSGQVFWFCGAAALGTGLYAAASRPGAVRNLLQSWFKGAS